MLNGKRSIPEQPASRCWRAPGGPTVATRELCLSKTRSNLLKSKGFIRSACITYKLPNYLAQVCEIGL